MLDPWWSGLASTTCPSVCGGGCGTWGLVGGGRVGTLLGPEASGPHPRLLSGCGVWACVSGCPSFALLLPCGGGGGLVGLLFEICIVDASIN